MEVVLRPVNDHFLREVVFPAFKLGVIDAAPAIEHLLRHLNDEHTRVGLDLLLERGVEGSFFGLTDEKWTEACYRLLFVEWLRDSEGWSIVSEYHAFAGEWENTLHLALMLEDPSYPYAEPVQARAYREAFYEAPRHKFGLATMICGVWDPVPDFPPESPGPTGAGGRSTASTSGRPSCPTRSRGCCSARPAGSSRWSRRKSTRCSSTGSAGSPSRRCWR
ncbi:MAG: hypothetical protein H6Q89_2451 [Myxococcaceae bacterium]|nr:hypothetical protein [Myxococcaceae bacterium]